MFPSPDGAHAALLDRADGSLSVRDSAGTETLIFPAGSTIESVTWSPSSQRLLALRTRWTHDDGGVHSGGALQIWQVELPPGRLTSPTNPACEDTDPLAGPAACLFQSPAPPDAGPEQLAFGRWAPDSRHVVFWRGRLSASLATDGLPAYVLDTTTGQTASLADAALLNQNYHTWSPGGTTLMMTAGGDRSALLDKRLIRYDVATGRSTTVIKSTELLPGMVAWSPDGQWVAYAAVDAALVDPARAHEASWDNPGIAGRRVYVMVPDGGLRLRVSATETFQDAPHWSADGRTLYYVERQGDTLVLMAYTVATASAAPVPVAPQPLPETAGYFGRLDLDALLAFWPTDRRPNPTPAPRRGG